MNILFLGCAYSQNQLNLFQTNSIRGFQHAAQNLQFSLIDGFLQQENVKLEVISIPSLSTFPQGCKLIKIPDSDFLFETNLVGKSFGFINLPIINHFHKNKVDRHIDNWYYKEKGEKCIFVYAMLKEQMEYAVKAKNRHKDIKLCLIIPDLPMYMNCNKYYKILGLQKRNIKAINTLLLSFDKFIVLAEPMIHYLHIENKPYIVLEGIYRKLTSKNDLKKGQLNKSIMYAGGIQSRYGVFDLIEAFYRIKNDKYKLILCGPCLEMDKLNSYLVKDKRIEYLGLIPTLQVRQLQNEVSLLVNPRHSNEEFTKYSFPSKTLEYMASGTPVLMSKLPSMPKEYEQYLYLFNDESIDGMKNMIEVIFSLDSKELVEKGKKAKDFIIKNKTPKKQVNNIMQLISDIS